jgi:hypothetical protein
VTNLSSLVEEVQSKIFTNQVREQVPGTGRGAVAIENPEVIFRIPKDGKRRVFSQLFFRFFI